MPQIREQIAMVHLPPSKTLKYLFHVRKTSLDISGNRVVYLGIVPIDLPELGFCDEPLFQQLFQDGRDKQIGGLVLQIHRSAS